MIFATIKSETKSDITKDISLEKYDKTKMTKWYVFCADIDRQRKRLYSNCQGIIKINFKERIRKLPVYNGQLCYRNGGGRWI